jgi:hypothetical protein
MFKKEDENSILPTLKYKEQYLKDQTFLNIQKQRDNFHNDPNRFNFSESNYFKNDSNVSSDDDCLF